MSHNIITECPICSTRFQVTSGQLEMAHGQVRCGECLTVFNALARRCHHLTEPLDDLAPYNTQDQLRESFHDPLHSPHFDKIDVRPFQSQDSNHRGDHSDLSTPPPEPFSEPKDSPTKDTIQPLVRHPLEDSVHDHLQPSPEPQTLNLSTTFQASKKANSASGETTQQPHKKILNDSLTTNTATVEIAVLSSEARPQSSQVKRPPSGFTPFQTEPISIKATRNNTTSQRRWGLLSLITLFLLSGQYLWFNRQSLSAYPELAASYQYACQYLPCQLSPTIKLDQIKIHHLKVRNHPDYQGALIVDLFLENQADTAQPYPAVLLSFSNHLGQPISQRIFQPKDYLDSTNTLSNMPAGMPLQIQFEIITPGQRAPSYEAILLQPRRLNDSLS